MANDYFVCLENRLGEASWTRFDSQAAFNDWYDHGKMEDETSPKVEYPRVPYQGSDEKACSEMAVVRNQRLLEEPDAYALICINALTENWGAVDRIYRCFFSD